MISNCGHDENGRYSGGAAGDQTGSEWQIRSWYNRPWNLVLRYPDRKIGDLIADLAIQAADNNLIGYDQGNRMSFWYALKNAGYQPKKITVKCETDCSAGVLSIVKAVGYLSGIKALQEVDPNGWTGSMRQQLKAAGFIVLYEPKYTTSEDYLLPGDILLNEQSHTAINISTGKYAADGYNPSKENVAAGQLWFNTYYGPFMVKTFGELLEVDGIYGPKSRASALAIWKDLMNRMSGSHLNVTDGVFDTECKKLARYAAVEFGSEGTYTFICEFILAAKGFYSGPMDADCGRILCTAIQEYERAKGLTVDSSEPIYCSCEGEVWESLFK